MHLLFFVVIVLLKGMEDEGSTHGKDPFLAQWFFYGCHSEKLSRCLEKLLRWTKERAKKQEQSRKDIVRGQVGWDKCNIQ